MPTLNSEVATNGIGSGSNRLKIDANGQVKLEGAATQWDDIVGSVNGVKLDDAVGKVEFNFTEGTLTFESGGSITNNSDCIWFNLQKPHSCKAASMLKMHIHYDKADATARVFTLQYRIQANGVAKTTAWTTITTTTNTTNDVFPYTSGTINQIVRFPDIDWSTVGISTTVQFKMARTDALSGNVEVSFVDGHFESDSLGSNEEYVK